MKISSITGLPVDSDINGNYYGAYYLVNIRNEGALLAIVCDDVVHYKGVSGSFVGNDCEDVFAQSCSYCSSYKNAKDEIDIVKEQLAMAFYGHEAAGEFWPDAFDEEGYVEIDGQRFVR